MGQGALALRMKLVGGCDVELEMRRCVVKRDVMYREELVDFHAGVEAKQTADFGFGERAGTIAFEGEGFERGTGGVLAGGGELRGEGVRDFEGHLHGITVHFWGFVAARKKAIRSFRLRLHDGLRQSGSAFGAVVFPGLPAPAGKSARRGPRFALGWYSVALSALGLLGG
jgi:hypothetical protein